MDSTPKEEWSPIQRVAFRLTFAYVAIYTLDLKPVWDPLVPWAGRCLGLVIAPHPPTGSGDTLFDYVRLLCVLTLAAVTTVLWSLVDRRRPSYVTLHAALRVGVRYILAIAMVTYGCAKLFKTQFPFPGPERLAMTVGQLSPMGLLWTSMGYSTAYNVFTGSLELLGGALLFARRTTTLGALTIAGVMANVVTLNFSYDVPVKLYSLHLLVLALVLLAPEARRLADVLWFNRPVAAAPGRTPFSSRWLERAGLALKVVTIGGLLVGTAVTQWNARATYGDQAPRPALYGLYEVESFVYNGAELPPLATDERRWRRLTVNQFNTCGIQRMNDSRVYLRLEQDAERGTATFVRGEHKDMLSYARPDPEHLVLEGPFDGQALSVRLRRVDESSWLLVSRGFHWVNEYPFTH